MSEWNVRARTLVGFVASGDKKPRSLAGRHARARCDFSLEHRLRTSTCPNFTSLSHLLPLHHLNLHPRITPSSSLLASLTSIAIFANICLGCVVHPRSRFSSFATPAYLPRIVTFILQPQFADIRGTAQFNMASTLATGSPKLGRKSTPTVKVLDTGSDDGETPTNQAQVSVLHFSLPPTPS
jgi:hypothetical protein